MTSSGARLAAFARELEAYRYDPVGFARNILGVEPHVGQERWLRNSVRSENMLSTGNRWGKSQGAAIKRIHRCVYKKGWTRDVRRRLAGTQQRYHSVAIGPTADQARLVWYKGHGMLQGPRASWLVRDVKMTPFPTIEFVNGAIFEARSTARDGSYLLGHDYDDVNWDEAAYERKFELIRDNVLRMRLVDRAGMLDYTSTPNGRNPFGLYFLTGLPGPKRDPDLYSQTGSSFENPHIDHTRLERNAKRMNARMRRQNIGGEIVDAGGGFFAIEDLEAALDDTLTRGLVVLSRDSENEIEHAVVMHGRDQEAGNEGERWLQHYPWHRYVHFWDLADKKDWVVGWTIDATLERPACIEFERFHKRGWAYNYERIRARHHAYAIGDPESTTHRGSKTYLDLTGIGDVAVDDLRDIDAKGINFAGGRKDAILSDLQAALSLREIAMPFIPVAYDELKFYERDDKDLVQDCVMALAGGVHFSKRRPSLYVGAV